MDHSQNGKTLLMALAAVPVSHVINDTDKNIHLLANDKGSQKKPKMIQKIDKLPEKKALKRSKGQTKVVWVSESAVLLWVTEQWGSS